MTSHRANKRTPTRALDFTKPSLSLQDKEPITRPSYTPNKHHPRATPHAQHTRAKNWLFIKCLWSLWMFEDGGEERGGGGRVSPSSPERYQYNHALVLLLLYFTS